MNDAVILFIVLILGCVAAYLYYMMQFYRNRILEQETCEHDWDVYRKCKTCLLMQRGKIAKTK